MKYYTILGSLALSLLISNCTTKEQPPPPKEPSKEYASSIETRKELERTKIDQEKRKFEEDMKKETELFNSWSNIQYECKKPEVTPDKCANLYISYREEYKLTARNLHLVSALLTRYLVEAKRYEEAIQEGRKYLDSGKVDDELLPYVLSWKAIAHYGVGERNEGLYLLQYLQEKYPLSEPAEMARKALKDQKK